MIRYVAVKSDLEKAADFWFAWFQNSLFRAYMHTLVRFSLCEETILSIKSFSSVNLQINVLVTADWKQETRA